MPWNRTTQQLHKRPDDHGQNDLTDAEWTVIGPMPPKRGRMGRPRGVDLRSVFDAGRYILSTGCRWRVTLWISTVFHRPEPFSRMAAERAPGAYRASSPGPRAAVSGALRGAGRRPGRQPVGEDHGERRPRGHHAGRKVKGRKRHLIVDAGGTPVVMTVHTADIQDRVRFGPKRREACRGEGRRRLYLRCAVGAKGCCHDCDAGTGSRYRDRERRQPGALCRRKGTDANGRASCGFRSDLAQARPWR